jgi:hypothetical protein
MNIFYGGKNGPKIGGKQVNIVMRQVGERSISEKHFKCKNVRCAGNFFKWACIGELFDEQDFIDAIFKDASVAFGERHIGTSSFSYNFRCPVGWSSTAPIHNFRREDFERFCINKWSSGQRIRRNRTDLRAPKTDLVTVIYELKDEGEKIVIVIHSLYPGMDIGELKGDVSQREGCVFFDWDHPGED